MTDQEINVEIAKACGWTCVRMVHLRAIREDGLCGHPPNENHDAGVPDYCNELNAMWCAVDGLLDEERIMFYNTLKDMFGGYGEFWNATARQRAEAFLKTIGGWKE